MPPAGTLQRQIADGGVPRKPLGDPIDCYNGFGHDSPVRGLKRRRSYAGPSCAVSPGSGRSSAGFL